MGKALKGFYKNVKKTASGEAKVPLTARGSARQRGALAMERTFDGRRDVPPLPKLGPFNTSHKLNMTVDAEGLDVRPPVETMEHFPENYEDEIDSIQKEEEMKEVIKLLKDMIEQKSTELNELQAAQKKEVDALR